MQFWFGDPDFGTFWFIYKDPVNIFQNQFLRWNRDLKPVVFSSPTPKKIKDYIADIICVDIHILSHPRGVYTKLNIFRGHQTIFIIFRWGKE